MKRNLLIAATCFLLSGLAFGQQYRTAIGIKGGFGYWNSGAALNVKHFLGSKSAIEGSIGGGNHHIWFQGLYEINNNIEGGLDWYYGIGADVGFWSNGYRYHYRDRYYSGAWGGVDGVIGLEYTFNEIPLNLALDAQPTVRLFPYVGFGFGANLALRFAIK